MNDQNIQDSVLNVIAAILKPALSASGLSSN